ncbi:polygalacturonase-like [Canna indica]|uniref:Polygalacturonase-like n=1 Tax=Canna indica TaxID=4628 RepID=A0AAQ3KYR2_9LILI|nr:polygalacturonase-like [Canna indica]
MYLTKWDIITLPKNLGGLGVQDLHLKVHALHVKVQAGDGAVGRPWPIQRKLKDCVVVFLLTISFTIGGYAATYNVLEYGAEGTGNTDDSKAFMDPWRAACDDPNNPTFLVPGGMTFYLSQISFDGPCKSTLHVMLLYFHSCGNLRLSGLTFKDSPNKHIILEEGSGAQVNAITIIASEDSPNTDGIYVVNFQHVTISSSAIGTGDDCITIGSGSSDVNITGITCGPGHGISIGSLEAGNSEVAVEQIYVNNCTIKQTQNGVRIKTWQTSAVRVSDVHYTQVNGTTTSKLGINFRCSETVPCTGITMEDVSLRNHRRQKHFALLHKEKLTKWSRKFLVLVLETIISYVHVL